MFDPSKLNLDLDNIEKETEEANKGKTNHIHPTTKPEEQLHDNPVTQRQDEKILITQEWEVKKEEEEEKNDPLNTLNTLNITNNEEKIENSNLSIEEKWNYSHLIQEDKIIYDININSLLDVLNLILSKEYDYVTFESNDTYIEISFKQQQAEVEKKYIKFPIYSNILIKAKTLTKLNIEENSKTQEWKWDIQIKDKTYQLISKVVPGPFWEKLFLKLKETQKKVISKEKQKISLSKILWILGAGLFSVLIIGGAFLAFVLLNSNNVADLTFFNNLGVNVDSIKEFTSNLVDFVFFSILLIESIFLFTFIFKAILTKKEFKQKKIGRFLIATFLLIITTMSGFLWLTLSKKINSLNSQDYGKVIFYDNDKFLSNVFDENGAKVNIDDNLIGPITLRMDIQEFMKKVIDRPFTPKTLAWEIDGQKVEKPIQDYELIQKFDTVGVHDVNIIIEGTNIKGEAETITQEVAKINISHIIDITEKPQKSWWSVFDFNAQNLENLWKIKWFYIPNLKNKTEEEKTQLINKSLEKEVLKGFRFTSKMIFDEEVIVGMQLTSKQDTDESLDKIFIISKENNTNIKWEISFRKDPINDLKYTFFVENADTDFWNWVIETFWWKINDQEFTKQADIWNIEESSEVEYIFEHYDSFDISVVMTDSRWETKELSKKVEVPKVLKINNWLRIYNNSIEMDDFKYDKNVHEYFIRDIWVPTTLSFHTDNLGQDNRLYTLSEVKWDYDSNGDFDETSKKGTYHLETDGAHTITVEYTYHHRVLKDKIIKTQQTIFIDATKKDAIVNFEIKKDSNYTPVIVWFDASKSKINNENIQKFVWNYGDGIIEERDAIVPGHKYVTPGDYEITLTIIWENGQEFTQSKKLILKPKPQSVEISTSLKQAPVGQGIDFNSNKSEWQITSYLWKFWDGHTSSEANPSYQYDKPWKYKVELTIEFSNKNVMSDTIEIEVTNN